ncbi:protein Hook homolog 3 isoform X2 [Lingula anatina]|uniref:Protein Hook homolog 3 isoform X1 n=1 Tax=Lingula anatina TaxID=7574 RepID=A0A1S3JYV2_LINAN|nr:protein Hook homolog 3 isoform X1 [Lingula anatina]XP_013415211.1 protein Hook homolog 3 isoform X2 [Lingula anatina]|eukprot:XP_013415210.1 protein Hook homolog 3 isoform X1 [Lingula anatina]
MDKEHLSESLSIWVRTFNIDVPNTDLTDGVLMSHVLHQIAPAFFSETWMSKIKTDVESNWRLKVSNLKKILKGILEYYAEVLGQQITDFHMPDVNAIGERADEKELGRLLQLILGCAVNCEEKQEYIQRIMGMEESVQHVVMNAIQELMQKETPASQGEAYSEIAEQLKKSVEELNSVMEAKEEMAQRCHELDLQVAALQEEKSSIIAENERLLDKLNRGENLEDPSSLWKLDTSTPAGRRFQNLQNQVEQLQEELFRAETVRDDHKIKIELLEKELQDQKQKNDELSSLAEEARTLKDELDVLRHTSDKVIRYETTIESYKKKLEEMSDLRRQVKMLEEKNTSNVQMSLDLEEEVRKSTSLKTQLDAYKRQVQELQIKSSEETKRADKAEFEAKRTQEKMASLQREKERLVTERDSLRETNEELSLTNVLHTGEEFSGSPSDRSTSPGSLDMLSVPPEIKEKLIRLQHENKMLKLSKEGSEDENAQLVTSMLEDTKARNNELETENRLANQRILELEAQIEDLRENAASSASSKEDNTTEYKKRLNEQIQKNKELEQEVQKKRLHLDELEPRVASSNEKIQQLQDALNKKEDDMRHMEERYKKYLDKAKSVIRALDPKQNQGTSAEVQALKNQLQEKERIIEHLEKDQERSKAVKEQEEKLIVTAWYNLGMKLHRKAAEERLTNFGTGQSFLARQRQAHSRRTQSLASTHPNASR